MSWEWRFTEAIKSSLLRSSVLENGFFGRGIRRTRVCDEKAAVGLVEVEGGGGCVLDAEELQVFGNQRLCSLESRK